MNCDGQPTNNVAYSQMQEKDMKYVEGTAIEVWSNGIRLGFIFEDWFYPSPGVQISGEELMDIGTRLLGLSIIPVTTPGLSIDAATLLDATDRRKDAPSNSLRDRVSDAMNPTNKDRPPDAT